MIDNLQKNKMGLMPIRVLQQNLIHEFEHMNPDFLQISKKVMGNLGADPEILYNAEKEKIVIPKVLPQYGRMEFQETFLSYVWCISYSLAVLYTEVQVKMPRAGKEFDTKLAVEAYKLYEYAISLIDSYSDWDLKLPNPENCDSCQEDLIQRINTLYLNAMKFIMAHEFAHIELKHYGDYSAEIEKEADERAINLVLSGATSGNVIGLQAGIVIGLCSLLFFNGVTKVSGYPDTDDRIDAAFQVIQPKSQDALWGIAKIAYQLWDRRFNKGLQFQEGLAFPQDLYLSIKRQIEEQNKNS